MQVEFIVRVHTGRYRIAVLIFSFYVCNVLAYIPITPFCIKSETKMFWLIFFIFCCKVQLEVLSKATEFHGTILRDAQYTV